MEGPRLPNGDCSRHVTSREPSSTSRLYLYLHLYLFLCVVFVFVFMSCDGNYDDGDGGDIDVGDTAPSRHMTDQIWVIIYILIVL